MPRLRVRDEDERADAGRRQGGFLTDSRTIVGVRARTVSAGIGTTRRKVKNLLPDNRLHIYFSLAGNAVSSDVEHACLAMMPQAIRAAILHYRRWQDRQAVLFGKLLLLRALRLQFREMGMQKWRTLSMTPDGRPFIPEGPDFNISHSEDMVVLAVIEQGRVGIDVERIRPVNIDDFSEDLPEVFDLPGKYGVDKANTLFFDCWTRKEAVLKGSGEGLLAPLRQVALNGETARFRETTWFIRKLDVEDDYCCHVATDRPPGEVAIERVNLMNGVLLSSEECGHNPVSPDSILK